MKFPEACFEERSIPMGGYPAACKGAAHPIAPVLFLASNLKLVKNNVKRFEEIEELTITNWTRYPAEAG